MSSEKDNNWAIHADFNPCLYEVDERRHIPTKNSKKNPVFVKSVLESNCKPFRDNALRENSNLIHETYMKKNSIQTARQLYLSKQWSKREAVAIFVHLCLNNIWAPGERHVWISKNLSFSCYLQARNTFQVSAGPSRSRCFNRIN